MRELWPILLFAAVAVAAVAVAAVFEARRRRELEAFARRLGLAFAPGGGGDFGADFDVDYHGYHPFGVGRSRRSSNLVYGSRNGVGWRMFDYRYTTGSGKRRRTHRFGVVAAEVGLSFPRMTMRPEGVFDKIASLAGFDDINFESEAFSRRYHVRCADRARCYDLIHPRMMEYLLSLPAAHWQFGPGRVLIVKGGRFGAEELGRAMGMIEGFVERVPAYVRKDLV